MVKFRKIPGQDQPVVQPWPSSNSGWRLGVAISAALVLSGTIICTLSAFL